MNMEQQQPDVTLILLETKCDSVCELKSPCLSGVLANNATLQRLSCSSYTFSVTGIRALQPGLQANRTLRVLHLCGCGLRDDGIRLIADALAGNSTIEILAVEHNDITSVGLDDITRILESTHLKKMDMGFSRGIFNDEASTRRFARILSRQGFLKELNLCYCDLEDEVIHFLLDGLVGNTTIEVWDIRSSQITSTGLADITRLFRSTRLSNFDMGVNDVVFNDINVTRHFFRMLSRHSFLKVLDLPSCNIGDECIHLIADSLAGNTTMEAMDISHNRITCNGLAGIMCILELTQLKTLHANDNDGILNNEDTTQQFVSNLHHKESSVQELPWIHSCHLPPGDENSKTAMLSSIQNSLTRNKQLNRVTLLLMPTLHQQQQPNERTRLMMLKTWYKAIMKLATVPNNAGASAIFKLITARPQLLEKRLKRPAAAVAVAVAADPSREQKRRRL